MVAKNYELKIPAHSCIISLAANCNQEENLAEARRRLSQILFSTTYTEAIWTEPFKHPDSPLYLNQLVYAKTSRTAEELESELKTIERDMGRTPADRQQGIVCIDLDLMQHDDTRYHLRDWERPYIQQLLR